MLAALDPKLAADPALTQAKAALELAADRPDDSELGALQAAAEPPLKGPPLPPLCRAISLSGVGVRFAGREAPALAGIDLQNARFDLLADDAMRVLDAIGVERAVVGGA